MRSKASSKRFKDRMKELKKVSIRIDAKIAELKKIVSDMSKSLD